MSAIGIGNAQRDHCLVVIMVKLQVNNQAAGAERLRWQCLIMYDAFPVSP